MGLRAGIEENVIMTKPNELLLATDAQIDDAMRYASPMVLLVDY